MQSNVSRLGLAFAVEVGSDGKLETTPLVFNGVLYGTSTWSQVYAIDLRTNKIKWQWDPALVRGGFEGMGPRACCGPVNRGVALYDGKVYVGLLDGRLVALDAETGKIVWSVQTTPPNRTTDHGRAAHREGQCHHRQRRRRIRRARVSSAPTMRKPASRRGASMWCPAIRRRDLKTRRWPRPRRPGHGEWWKAGGGGTPWDGIAYDPELNLVYVGTGNGSPWNANHRSPGGGDNLYLSSIVALNADTGAYVWHYQTTPGDNWDYNAAQPMILADSDNRRPDAQGDHAGAEERLLLRPRSHHRRADFRASRTRYHLVGDGDRHGNRTSASKPKQARYRYTPVRLSPSPVGAHHWPPMAFNPTTRLVYYPGQETAVVFAMEEKFEFQEGHWNLGHHDGHRPATTRRRADPKAPTMGGFFVAWDPVAQKEAWRIPFQPSGGALSTAGQLIFVGNGGWQVHGARSADRQDAVGAATACRASRTPITYELDGKQYIAVMSGVNQGKDFRLRT